MTTCLRIAVLAAACAGLAPRAGRAGEPAEWKGKVFGAVEPKLSEHLDLMDRQERLPERRWFGADKRSNQRAMDELLDEAIKALCVSGLDDCRQRLRALEREAREGRRTLNRYRRERISAPPKAALNWAEAWRKSKEDYDRLIADEEKHIEACQKQIKNLKTEFAKQMRAIGLDLSDEAVESLLSSVSGDDFISMCIVFDNVKMVTEQLRKLTEQTGEDLASAKRYYGMYVVLVKVLDRVQKQFIRKIRDVYIPQLQKFSERAQSNIAEARRLIEAGQGDAAILQANIRSNELTQRAAEYYADYLRQQARMVENENRELQKTLATALNTYKTVKLSSDVAMLISRGLRNFDAIMKLRLPVLREFRNSALQRKFQILTQQMKGAV